MSQTDGEGINASLEKKFKTKDGRIVWGRVSSRTLQIPECQEPRLITVIEDITSQKESTSQLQTFLSISMDMMGFLNFEGTIKKINPRFKEIMGYAIHELSERPFLEFLHPDDVNETQAALVSLARKNGSSRFTNRFRTNSGGYKTLDWSVASDFENRLYYFSAKDVTDLREEEAQLLHSAKLSSLGQMAGGLAHEINNPLTIIQGKATLARRLVERLQITEKEPLLQSLNSIETNVERIAKIVKGLRTYSHEGSGDQFTMNSILKILEGTLELCQTRFIDSSIDLRLSPVSEQLYIECRPSQISQVILNLLNNAFDEALTSSHKWVGLEVTDAGPEIVISVTDSGSGISKENREKLFQPFFTTKPPGKGTGLGLSIIKGIVENHGGTIELNAELAHTCFTVRIPKKQKKSSN